MKTHLFRNDASGTHVRLQWYGDEIMEKVGKELTKRLDKAAEMVVKDIQNEFPPAPSPSEHSEEGEIPFIQTRRLLNSISWDKALGKFDPSSRESLTRGSKGRMLKSMTRRIFSDFTKTDNIPYGFYLELGTVKMAPRPWLAPAADRNKGKVGAIFKSPFRSLQGKGKPR